MPLYLTSATITVPSISAVVEESGTFSALSQIFRRTFSAPSHAESRGGVHGAGLCSDKVVPGARAVRVLLFEGEIGRIHVNLSSSQPLPVLIITTVGRILGWVMCQ